MALTCYTYNTQQQVNGTLPNETFFSKLLDMMHTEASGGIPWRGPCQLIQISLFLTLQIYIKVLPSIAFVGIKFPQFAQNLSQFRVWVKSGMYNLYDINHKSMILKFSYTGDITSQIPPKNPSRNTPKKCLTTMTAV